MKNDTRLQIDAAKARQKARARERASQGVGRKSMAAATTTPAQSEITSKPPNLYQVTRINTPADFQEVARLLHDQLTKIAESQSYILTLWEKLRGQVGGLDSVEFNVPVEFSDGVTIGGKSGFNIIPDEMPTGSTSFDDTHWGWCRMSTSPAESPGTWDGYGVCLTYSMHGTEGYSTPLDYINALKGNSNCWVVQEATDTHGTKWIRSWVNAGPWGTWQKITTTADATTSTT